MKIQLATSDAEIAACYATMQELRPHIVETDFVLRVRGLARQGYQLAYIQIRDRVVAVAGFRVGDNLAWGRFLYVDDLVTRAAHRSSGYGNTLLTWLKTYASTLGCAQIHLDSGIQRRDAHRFYEHMGMRMASFHYVDDIASE